MKSCRRESRWSWRFQKATVTPLHCRPNPLQACTSCSLRRLSYASGNAQPNAPPTAGNENNFSIETKQIVSNRHFTPLGLINLIQRPLIWGHACARHIGRDIESGFNLCRRFHPVAQPGNVFEQRARGARKAEMLVHLTHVAHVGHNREAVAARHVGHLPELRDAGQAGHVRLHIMHRSSMDEIPELRRGILRSMQKSPAFCEGWALKYPVI